MEELWRRIVFNILISNTDDHLRDHGFLYEGSDGWRLSPAYDLNPVPTDIKPHILTTAINEDDGTASLALAMSVAKYFELDTAKAREIAKQVGKAVSRWARRSRPPRYYKEPDRPDGLRFRARRSEGSAEAGSLEENQDHDAKEFIGLVAPHLIK